MAVHAGRSHARRPADAALLLARLVAAVALGGGVAAACDGGKADGDKTGGDKAAGSKSDGGKADGGEADGGKADGGKSDGGKADGGKADGGKADGGKADGGKADGGKADGGEADGGEADGGPPPPPEPPEPPKVVELGKCPGGDWCGPRPDAHRVATTKKPSTLGCPPKLGGKEDPKLRTMAVYEGLPVDQTAMFANVDEPATQAKRDTGDTQTCCYKWTIRCPGGRPWLDGSQPVTAAFEPARDGEGWSGGEAPATPGLDPAVRRRVADAWVEDAAMEHASIASFARVTLELLAVAAPPELVAATQRAGLDEVKHAQACLRLAASFGVGTLEPGPLRPLPPRESSLSRLAVDVFVEGCVGETTAALVAERAAARCETPAIRGALVTIAADEADHAALAWRTLRWALAEGGDPVRRALAETVVAMRDEVTPAGGDDSQPVASNPDDGDLALRVGGRLGPAALQQARRDAWLSIVTPMLAQLGVA